MHQDFQSYHDPESSLDHSSLQSVTASGKFDDFKPQPFKVRIGECGGFELLPVSSANLDTPHMIGKRQAKFERSAERVSCSHEIENLQRLAILPSAQFSGWNFRTWENHVAGKNANEQVYAHVGFEAGGNYLLRARVPKNQFKEKSIPKDPIQELSVLSGSCLFGASGAKLALGDTSFSLVNPLSLHELLDQKTAFGTSDAKLVIDPHLSLYETETAARLGGFLDEVCKQCPVSTVGLHVPRIEYYLYVLPLIEAGVFPRELFPAWKHAVDERAEIVRQLFCERIGRTAEIASPLQQLEAAGIFDHIESNGSPGIYHALAILDDPFWKDLISYRSSSESPSWYTLCELSYVAAYLQAGEARPGKFLLTVEAPEEERILIGVERALKGMSNPPAISLAAGYIHEQLFIEQPDAFEDVAADKQNIRRTLLFYSGAMQQRLIRGPTMC